MGNAFSRLTHTTGWDVHRFAEGGVGAGICNNLQGKVEEAVLGENTAVRLVLYSALAPAAISTRSRDQGCAAGTAEDKKRLFQALPSRGYIDFGRQAWERRIRGGVPRYAGSEPKTSGCEEDPQHFG